MEDGVLSGSSLVWNSSVDGLLGNGNSISVQLSPGTHTISLTATDSDGATGIKGINIIVVASGAVLLNTLSDGSTSKDLTFSTPGD